MVEIGKGAISPTTSDTIKGVATATYAATASDFTIEELPSTVTITASVNDFDGVPDKTLTLNITDKVSKIVLSASPETIWADYSGDDGPYESTVTAELLDANDGPVQDAINIITFAISGEGNFVDDSGNILSNLITVTPINGSASIKVKSIDNNPGTIIVTASSEGLVSDSITIVSLGVPTSIAVSIFVSDGRNYIYNDGEDSATVRVSILDQKSNLIPFGGVINLQGMLNESEVGSFSSVTFISDGVYEATFTCIEAGTVTITASGSGLTPGSSTIVVKSSLTADSISLSADSPSIPASGLEEDASTITATVKSGAYIVENYENQIYFTIVTADTDATFLGETTQYTNEGIAEIKLIPSINAGSVTIEASTTNSEGTLLSSTIVILFFVSPDHIILSSEPQNIQVGNKKFEVKAIMMDENNVQISNYNGSVNFDISPGFPGIIKYQTSNTQSLITTFSGGEVILNMKSVNEAGTATLHANSGDISGSLNIPVGISVTLVEDEESPKYVSNETENSVSFDIEILGALLKLEEMQIFWDPSSSDETLNKIEIDPNSTGNSVIYPDTSTIISSGELIHIEEITTLSEGTPNVKIYFNTEANMSGKDMDVIFNPNSGNYPVEFIVQL